MSNGKGKIIYNNVNQLLHDRGLPFKCLIFVSIDGALAIIGHESGFVLFLKKDFPNLIALYYIVHHKAITTKNASKIIPKLLFIKNIANKLYSWV